MYKYFVSIFAAALLSSAAHLKAQEPLKSTGYSRKSILKDTLDGKLDLSSFLIDSKGFVPVPVIITEPAVGGFGGLIAPMFIIPKKVAGYKGYIPPDITAAMGMYTANGSWALGAFRSGSFPKAGIKYRVFAGYINLNLDYYRTLPLVGEKKFTFNRRSVPVSLAISKKMLKEKQLYLGISYSISPTKMTPKFDGQLPSFIKRLDLDNTTASLGLFADLDRRNTIFTPDKGIRIHIAYEADGNWTGSDYSFQRLNAALNWFAPVNPNWISGVRVEVQHVFNDPPFFLLPGIDMRGIAKARYQGVTTGLIETEQRFDVNLRWSILGFAGLGKAIDRDQTFSDAKTVYTTGTGFRYLLSRVFKLRAGVDIARGPDNFAWYIVFGHNWNR
jgi:hypothetical protein